MVQDKGNRKKIISRTLSVMMVAAILVGVALLGPLRIRAEVSGITVGATTYGPDHADGYDALPAGLSVVEDASGFRLVMENYSGTSPITITSTAADTVTVVLVGNKNKIEILHDAIGISYLANGGTLAFAAQGNDPQASDGLEISRTGAPANASANAPAISVPNGTLSLNGGTYGLVIRATGGSVSVGNVDNATASPGVVAGNITAATNGSLEATGGALTVTNGTGGKAGPGVSVLTGGIATTGGSVKGFGGNGTGAAGGAGIAIQATGQTVSAGSRGGGPTGTGGTASGYDNTAKQPYKAGDGITLPSGNLSVTGDAASVTFKGGAGAGNANPGGHGISAAGSTLTIVNNNTDLDGSSWPKIYAYGGAGAAGTSGQDNPDDIGGTGGTGISATSLSVTGFGTLEATGGAGGNGPAGGTGGNGGDAVRTEKAPAFEGINVRTYTSISATVTGGSAGSGGARPGTAGDGIDFDDGTLSVSIIAHVKATGGAAGTAGTAGAGVRANGNPIRATSGFLSATGGAGNESAGGAGIDSPSGVTAQNELNVTAFPTIEATGGAGTTGGAGIHFSETGATLLAESKATVTATGGNGSSTTTNAGGGAGIHYSANNGALTANGQASIAANGGTGGTGNAANLGPGGDGVYMNGTGFTISITNAKLEAKGGGGLAGGSVNPTRTEGGNGIRADAATITFTGEQTTVGSYGGTASTGANSYGGFGILTAGPVTVSGGARVNLQGNHTLAAGTTNGVRGGDGILTSGTNGTIHVSGDGTSLTAGGGNADATSGTVYGGYGIFADAGITLEGGAAVEATGGDGNSGAGGTGIASSGNITVSPSARLTALGGDSASAAGGKGVIAGYKGTTGALSVSGGRLAATAGQGASGNERIAILSATRPQVSGGTSVITGTVRYPSDATTKAFDISGGSWHILSPATPGEHNATREGGNNRVYCVTIQLDTLGADHLVSGVTLHDSKGAAITNYGLTDVYTDAEGKVYLWIPLNATVQDITSGGVTYYPQGSAVAANDTSTAAGTYRPRSDSSTSTSASGSVSSTTSGSTSSSASGSGSTSGSSSSSSSSSGSGAPQTGDEGRPLLWFGLSCLALAMGAMLYILRRNAIRPR